MGTAWLVLQSSFRSPNLHWPGALFHPLKTSDRPQGALPPSAAHNSDGMVAEVLCLATLGLLGHVTQLPHTRSQQRVWRPPSMRVSVRKAEDAELRFQGRDSRMRPISVLVAQGFVPADASDQQVEVMASQLGRNLAQKFSSRNPEPSALLIAESGADQEVATCMCTPACIGTHGGGGHCQHTCDATPLHRVAAARDRTALFQRVAAALCMRVAAPVHVRAGHSHACACGLQPQSMCVRVTATPVRAVCSPYPLCVRVAARRGVRHRGDEPHTDGARRVPVRGGRPARQVVSS